MTISSTTVRVNAVANGVTTTFPVNIQAYQASDFEVVALNTNSGAETALVLNQDYTLSPAGTSQPPFWNLGTLTGQFPSPFATGIVLQVILDPVQTQQNQFSQGEAFPSAAIQQTLDRLTQMILRQQDINSRSLAAPDGDLAPLMTLPSAAARANTAMLFGPTGNATVGVLLATALTQALFNSYLNTSVLWAPTSAENAALIVPTQADAAGNVLRYNADPSGNSATATQTTAAINAALLQAGELAALGIADVVLPPGIYCINGPLNVPPGVTIRGSAKDLYPNFTTDWQSAIPSWGFSASTLQYAQGSHGPIFSGGSTSEFFGLVIRCGQVRNSTDNVWATGTEPSHIRMHGCCIQNMSSICNNQSAAYGAWQMYSNQITGCGPGSGGIFQGVLVDMLVWGNAFTSTNGYVFDLTGGAGDGMFFHNRFEEGSAPAFVVNQYARQHVIVGNVFDNNATAAVQLNSADPGQWIVGNYFNRNGSNSGSTILNSCHIMINSSGGHVIDNIYTASAGDAGIGCTFTVASNQVNVANSFNAGQPVTFSSTGTLPTGITSGQTYFVSATGLSSAAFQVSASYALAIAGTSIALSGTPSGQATRNTLNPLWCLGLSSCIGVLATRFSGPTRNACATSQLIIDQYGTSVAALKCPDALALPAGANPGNANDEFETALSTINNVCAKGTQVELYENRTVNAYGSVLGNITLLGKGATAPTLTNNSGAIGFNLMDNVTYGALAYTSRRGQQYASAAPNGFNTQGLFNVGDAVWNTAPASAGAMAWALTTIGSPNTWTTFTLN